MITIVNGTNQSELLNFIKYKKTQYTASNIFVYELSSINLGEIKDIAYSNSLFGRNRLIILNVNKQIDNIFDESFLSVLKNSKNVEVIINCEDRPSLQLINSLKKDILYKEFNERPDYSSFNLAYSILNREELSKILATLSTSFQKEEAIFQFIGAFNYYLRILISTKYNNQLSKNIKAYEREKLNKIKIEEKTLKKMYAKLVELDLKIKTSQVSKKNILKDFLIDLYMDLG